jgi:hypothetical protein
MITVVLIDDDVPIPPQTRGPGATKGMKFQPRIPLSRMKLGQSIFVPEHYIDGKKLGNRIARATRLHGYRYTRRAWQEKGVLGLRIWRIS